MRRKERLLLMKEWSESHVTKKRFCKNKGLNYGTFLSWFQQEKAGKNEVEEGNFVSISEVSHSSIYMEALLPNGIALKFYNLPTLETLKLLNDV